MELFTLGVGHYSESDVKEIARALTGLEVRDGDYQWDLRRHDTGEKRILGHIANFKSESVAELLLEHPATAKRLAWRLVREFFGEGVIDQEAHAELAVLLRKSDLDIAVAVETILHSQLFLSDQNINTRISDPLSFLITPLRVFELFDTPPSTLVLADWLRRMGLDLFYPPNVGGWEGSRDWLSTRTIIGRANYVAAVVGGDIHQANSAIAVASGFGCKDSLRACLEKAGELLRGELRPKEIDDALSPEGRDLATAIVNLMAQPRAHLH